MIRRKKGDVEWLEFEQLQEFPEVIHGVFLRHGGVSGGPFGSLNFGGGTGDSPVAIKKNREKAFDLFQLTNIVTSMQVHGSQVASVPTQDIALERGCDGLMTDQKNVGLLIKHVDCQAVIFFDPVKKVVANIHCGWRGSVQNIYAKTIEKMCKEFGSFAIDIRVCISPSLGPEKAEFIHYKKEFPKEFWPFKVKKNYFNFWEIAKMQLKCGGILEKHIEIAEICTYTEKRDFFSYRREKKSGRHGTIVVLKPA